MTEPNDATVARPSFAGTLMERMGITVWDRNPKGSKGKMLVAGNTQPFGLLHGGASAVLVETLGSVAASEHAGPGRMAVGVELNVTHHRGVGSGFVHGVATSLHLGRSLATYQVEITDDDGKLVCSGRLTCMLLDQ